MGPNRDNSAVTERRIFRAVVIWLLAAFPWLGPSVGAADSNDSNPTPAGPVAHLQYREVDFAPLAFEISVEGGARFSKEPAFAGKRVFHGRLRLGTDTHQFVPFAWDIDQRKLYLDLNRNGNLSDDPAGVLTAPGKDLQLFRGIPLAFPSTDGAYRVLVDAHVFGQGGDDPNEIPRVFLYVRSLWDGAVELNGKKWYLAVIDNPDGRIGPASSDRSVSDRMILRPWEDRDKPCLWWHASLERVHALDHVKLVNFPYRWAGNAEVFDAFNLPASFFFQNQAYRLSCRVEPANGPANLAVNFASIQPPLGRILLGGDYIRRVVLDNGASPDGFIAVVDSPAAEVQVPVGAYPRQIVLLQREGFTNASVGLATNRLAVAVGGSTTFIAGGPLQSGVAISTDSVIGPARLNYQLTNAAGIPFGLVVQDEKSPPRLEIRQGNKLVAQGKFEFG
jgi:hypothetical protein